METMQRDNDGRDPREMLLAVEVRAPAGQVWFPATQFHVRSLLLEALLKTGIDQGTVSDVVQRLDLYQGLGSGDPDRNRPTYEGFSFEHRNGQGTVGVQISRFREEVGAALRDRGLPVLDLDRIGRMYYRRGDTPGMRTEEDVPPELRPYLLNGSPRVTLQDLARKVATH